MSEKSETPIQGVTKEDIAVTKITIKPNGTVSSETTITPVLVIDPKELFRFGETPDGRRATRHYGLETGPTRNIPGSVVDDVIRNNRGSPVDGGKTVYYDPANDVTVVTGTWGSIVSVHRGPPGKGEK